jgi:predicted RNase H-like HicB family nuclease
VTNQYRYLVVLKPTVYEDEVGYTVNIPALPGCITESDTVEEALANAREAISLYIESLMADNLPIPPSDEVIATVEVPVASPAPV